jgi:molybdopterin molybdotransferase
MIPLEEAWGHVRSRLSVLPAESVPVADALGLVVADPVVATEPVPPFDNSAVDGFAVRAADVDRAGVELRVVARRPAS